MSLSNSKTKDSTSVRVLFVDDQQVLLKAVQRVVSRKKRNWVVECALSGIEAIEQLKNNSYDVLVTDMRMPGMDGIELLDYVKINHPNIIRFILSGFSKNEQTTKSIRVAHQFFLKPFPIQSLIEALELTHTLYKRISDPELQTIVSSIDRLPTPKKIFYEINEAINDGDTTIEEIASIIASDVAVSGKILQVVNSAFFGQSHQIDHIEHAIKILGFETVKSLILVAGIVMDHSEILSGIISLDMYSNHSMEVARISKEITRHLKMDSVDQNALFTIGVLHEVGRLVLLKKYVELCHAKHQDKDYPLTQDTISSIHKLAEQHSSVGAALIALWGLPPKLATAIAYYEDPLSLKEGENQYAMILHIADGIANYQSSNTQEPILDSPYLKREVVEQLLSVDSLESILSQLDEI